MEENYKILGINKTRSLNEIKKAYFNRIKEYPPEENGMMFIKINKAYKELKKYINGEYEFSISDTYIKRLEECINNKDNRRLRDIVKDLGNYINKNNFKEINDKIIDYIISLYNKGEYQNSLYITFVLHKRFTKLGLIALADAYTHLEEHIVFD